jgi:hypothetical protein
VSDYQWVLPRIAVGGMPQSYDLEQLKAEDVGYLVNASNQPEPFDCAENGITEYKVQIDDDGQSKYDAFLAFSLWFMSKWWENPKKKFLFHCGAGVNRGPSTCMLALMLLRLSASAAYKGIVTARPIAAAGLAYREDACRVAEQYGFLVR